MVEGEFRTLKEKEGAMLGFFAKKNLLFEFVLDLYSTKKIVFQADINNDAWLPSYQYFLDSVIRNLGPTMWQELFNCIGQRVIEAKEEIERWGETEDSSEHLRHPAQTEYQVVSSPPAEGRKLRITAKLFRKNDLVFIEGKYSPLSYPNTEETVMAGCEGLFVHFFNSVAAMDTMFLVYAVDEQLGWYENNGYPSLRALGAAPAYGLLRATAIMREYEEGSR